MDRIISYRPDTASNWASNNIVLSQGEGGIEIDTDGTEYKYGGVIERSREHCNKKFLGFSEK